MLMHSRNQEGPMAAEDENLPFNLEVDDLEIRDLLEERFPHPLQALVLPVVVMKGGVAYLQGTAFSIGGNLALTAHHVLTQEDTDTISQAALLHVVDGVEPGQVHATLLEVDVVTAHPDSTDVSVLQLKTPPPGFHNPMPLRPLRLGMAPPTVGQMVSMLGYTYVEPMTTLEEVFKLRPKLHVSTGSVTQVEPLGSGLSKGPCFLAKAESISQMSGGPVFAHSGGGNDPLAVRGVISTGLNAGAGDDPLTTVGMAYTALALNPPVDRGMSVEPTLLYDLAHNGRIPVVDLDLVDLDVSDPAKPRLGLNVNMLPQAHD